MANQSRFTRAHRPVPALFAIVLAVQLLAWPDGAASQGAFPAMPRVVSVASVPELDWSQSVFQRLSSPQWQPLTTVTLPIRADPRGRPASGNLFCSRASGPAAVTYEHSTPAADDIVLAHYETTACPGRTGSATVNAILKYRNGGIWAGNVIIERGRALPRLDNTVTAGRYAGPDGHGLVFRPREVLDAGTYTRAVVGVIGANGTVMTPDWGVIYDSGAVPVDRWGDVIDYAYKPGGARLNMPDGNYFVGRSNYYSGFIFRMKSRTVGGVDRFTRMQPYHSGRGEFVAYGDYDLAPGCAGRPGPYRRFIETVQSLSVRFDADNPAQMTCMTFEYVGPVLITTTARTILGPAGHYTAPFGSFMVGRGPALADMIVPELRHTVRPSTPADLDTFRSDTNNYYSRVEQAYQAEFDRLAAPLRQARQERRANERARRDAFDNLVAGIAMGLQNAERQQRYEATERAAYRSRVASFMNAPVDHAPGSVVDPAERRRRQDAARAESARREQAEQDRETLRLQQVAEQERARVEAAAQAAETARMEEAERASRTSPAGEGGAGLDLYLVVRPSEPAVEQTPPPSAPPPSSSSPSVQRPPPGPPVSPDARAVPR